VQLAALYAVVFAVYGCAQFTRPVRTALIGDRVAAPHLPQASGLIETMVNPSLIIGIGIAPGLFVPFGIGIALIADALSFALAFAAILAVKAPPAARSVKAGARGNFQREFINGVRFSLSNLVIRTLLIVYTVVLFGSGAINALLVFFLSQTLHAPKEAIGIFPVVLGLGLLVGSLLSGGLVKRVGLTRIFWLSIILLGVFAIALSRQTSLIPGLVFGFLVGVPNGIANVALMPLVLHVTPRAMVGRVMAVLGQTFGTYDLLILIPGVLCLLAGAIAFSNLRRVTLTPETSAAGVEDRAVGVASISE
jgi:predicted MFS family arabinose efflux permease